MQKSVKIWVYNDCRPEWFSISNEIFMKNTHLPLNKIILLEYAWNQTWFKNFQDFWLTYSNLVWCIWMLGPWIIKCIVPCFCLHWKHVEILIIQTGNAGQVHTPRGLSCDSAALLFSAAQCVIQVYENTPSVTQNHHSKFCTTQISIEWSIFFMFVCCMHFVCN